MSIKKEVLKVKVGKLLCSQQEVLRAYDDYIGSISDSDEDYLKKTGLMEHRKKVYSSMRVVSFWLEDLQNGI